MAAGSGSTAVKLPEGQRSESVGRAASGAARWAAPGVGVVLLLTVGLFVWVSDLHTTRTAPCLTTSTSAATQSSGQGTAAALGSGVLIAFSAFENPKRRDLTPNPMVLAAVIDRAHAVMPEAHIVVLISSDKLMADGPSALAQYFHSRTIGTAVDWVNVSTLPSATADLFRSRYRPQSVNPYAYELWCLVRWFFLDAYIGERVAAGTPVDAVLGLDADVLLLEPMAALLAAPNGTFGAASGGSGGVDRYIATMPLMEMVVWTLGAVVGWTPLGLRSFTHYLLAQYATAESTAAGARAAGHYIPWCEVPVEEHQAIELCRNGTLGDYTGPMQLLVDDMHWMQLWATLQPASRVAHPRDRPHTCDAVGRVQSLANGGVTLTRVVDAGGTGLRPYPIPPHIVRSDTGRRLCYAHFQGPTKSYLLDFAAFVRGDTRATSYTITMP